MIRKSQLGAALGNEGMQFNLEIVVAEYQAIVSELAPADNGGEVNRKMPLSRIV
jgi:hypothetical protein